MDWRDVAEMDCYYSRCSTGLRREHLSHQRTLVVALMTNCLSESSEDESVSAPTMATDWSD